MSAAIASGATALSLRSSFTSVSIWLSLGTSAMSLNEEAAVLISSQNAWMSPPPLLLESLSLPESLSELSELSVSELSVSDESVSEPAVLALLLELPQELRVNRKSPATSTAKSLRIAPA
jgi:hypothetical protein